MSECIDELWRNDQSQKQAIADGWRKYVRFLNGDQVNAPRYGSAQDSALFSLWREAGLSKRNSYVTNLIAPNVRAIVSFLTRARTAVECFPASNAENDRKQARIAQNWLSAKYEIDNEISHARHCAYWGAATGTVFRKDGLMWDESVLYVPKSGPEGEPVFGENGEELYDEVLGGELGVKVIPPFGMAFDWSYLDFNDVPWVMEGYLAPVDWCKEVFGRKSAGFTGADITQRSTESWSALAILEELKYSTQLRYGRSNVLYGKSQTLVREVFTKPTKEWPSGRMLVKVGDQIVFDSSLAGENPYFLPMPDKIWHPYSCFIYEKYLGRLLGAGLIEKILPYQIRYNEITGFIIENTAISAKVRILAAKGSIVKDTWSNQEGSVLEYNPSPAGPPSHFQGLGLPPQVFAELDRLERRAVEDSASNFILQGRAPQGVTAAQGIEMLLENASTQLSDTMNSWEKFFEQAFTKKLRFGKKFSRLKSPKIESYLKTISPDATNEDLKEFAASDLSDGIVLKIEAGSSVPKSEKMRREFYMQLIDKGFFGPINEPSARGARARNWILAKFGEKKFKIDENVDVEKSNWENERIKKGLPPFPDEFDNHEIHYSCHIYDLKDPVFIENYSEDVQAVLREHANWHKAQMQQAQMQAQGGVPPPPQEMPQDQAPVQGPEMLPPQ